MAHNLVTVYSRHGCHLCDAAVECLETMTIELEFEIEIKYIDGNVELEKMYGEQVPVILIDGEHHDFWKVDPIRFRASLEKHRQHR
ncbi:MAG: thioredoxin family protein [Actinobacteria bacterium]|nr:thioredoxin family protein [Actinomycetota bacterium]